MGELGTKLPSPRLQIPLDGKGRGVLSLEESRNGCQGHGSAWQLQPGGRWGWRVQPPPFPCPLRVEMGMGAGDSFPLVTPASPVGHPGPLLPGTTVQGTTQSPSLLVFGSVTPFPLRDRVTSMSCPAHPLEGDQPIPADLHNPAGCTRNPTRTWGMS